MEEIKNLKTEAEKEAFAKQLATKLKAAKSSEERRNIVAETGLKLSDEALEKIAGGILYDENNNDNNTGFLDPMSAEILDIMSQTNIFNFFF